MTKTIISLTSIPPRFKGIEATLNSLVNQTAQVDEIALYIPKHYRREQLNYQSLPKLPEGVKLYVTEEDYGPASKILHAVKQYQGQDIRIIYCDDDNIYDEDWAQKFIDASEDNPNCCIAAYGRSIADTILRCQYKFSKNGLYRLKRILSLGLWRAKKNAPIGGEIGIAAGFAGVMVRPEFFHKDVFDIPDIMWTVDDVWLSGSMALNNTRIIVPESLKASHKPNLENRVAELRKFSYKGYNRAAADMACCQYFQEKYDIWHVPELDAR